MALIIKSTAQPGQRAAIFSHYQDQMVPRAVDNDAQELVVWCADQHDPDVFYLFEIYRDAESFGANAQAPWFAQYMETVGPLLAGEPEVSMASPQWTKLPTGTVGG